MTQIKKYKDVTGETFYVDVKDLEQWEKEAEKLKNIMKNTGNIDFYGTDKTIEESEILSDIEQISGYSNIRKIYKQAFHDCYDQVCYNTFNNGYKPFFKNGF
jgi:regulator of replication initiation timing